MVPVLGGNVVETSAVNKWWERFILLLPKRKPEVI